MYTERQLLFEGDYAKKSEKIGLPMQTAKNPISDS